MEIKYKINTITGLHHAVWEGKVIAENDNLLSADGYIYFPPESVRKEYLKRSDHHSFCPWKGTASYYDIVINNSVNKNAAWYYPEPFEQAFELKDRIGFWKGVEIKKVVGQ